MRKYFNYLLFAAMIFVREEAATAQNMNSPYSVYGIGDIDFRSYNRTAGMGGAGLATMSSVYLVDNNPAALSGLKERFYLFNASFAGKLSTYNGTPVNNDNRYNRDAWVKGLTLGVKIFKFWGSSVGFNQFTNVNYKYTGSQYVEGTTNLVGTTYDGSGGLNDFYWTNSIALGKHFSVGVKASYIGGPVLHDATISDVSSGTGIVTNQHDYYGGGKLEYGLMFSTPVTKKLDISIGGKFSNKSKLTADRTLNVYENDVVVIENKLIKSNSFYLPMSYGAGITAVWNRKTTVSLDYIYENWNALGVRNSGWKLVDSRRIAAGIQYSWFAKQWRGASYEKNFLQAGFFMNDSYLSVRGKQISQYGVTVGYGGVLRGNLLYTLSAEAGSRGTTTNNLIKENYVQLTLGISYRDYLFTKGRRYE